MINLQSGDVNKLRQMLASGQITEDQLLAMSFHGGDSAPQQAPQNALAQALSPQQAFARGDTSGDLPMGSMRNEATGKITYFQPDPQAPRTNADPGFSDTPYPLPSSRPQSPRARLYGYGDGGLTDLGEDTSGAIPLDYSRGQIEVPGVGKAHYSRDGRFAVARGPNGEAVKVMLGYDAAASDRRNDMALKHDSAMANIEQTREQTGLLRDKRAMLANPPEPVAPGLPGMGLPQSVLEKQFGKAPEGKRWNASGQLENVEGGNQKVTDAKDVLSILNLAEPLLNDSTGSYGGFAVDKLAQVFGVTTPGANAGAQLKALQGLLVSKMPKMSGPQSDKDVLLYKEMAGQIGDPTIPAEQKQAAMVTIRAINERYAGMQPGSSKPTPEPDATLRLRAISEAKAAIAQGKSREGVRAKLRDMGIDPGQAGI